MSFNKSDKPRVKLTSKIILPFLILMLATLSINVSSQELEALKKQYSETHNVVRKVELLSILATEYLTINPDSSLYFSKLALGLSKNAEIENNSSSFYGIIGDVLVMKDSLLLAEKYYDSCLFYHEKENNYFEVVGVLTVLGNINVVLNNTSKGLQYYLRALKISLDNNYQRRLPYLYLNIGTTQFNANNPLEAQNYYSKALEGFEKVDDSVNFARVLSSLGSTYSRLNNNNLANEYYQRSLLIFLNLNSYADIASSYHSLSILEKEAGTYEKAIEYLTISQRNIDLIDYTFAGPRMNIITQVEVELGENYLMLGNLDKSKQHLINGFELASKNGLLSNTKNAAENLSILYEQIGSYDSSLYYHKIFKKNAELLINEENIKKLANLDAQNKYEQLLKEEEVRRNQEKVAQRRNTTIYIVAIVILILFILVLVLFLKLGQNKVTRIELQRINLQNELELRNKELTTHVVTQLKKNELIMEISGKLEKTLAAANPGNKPIIERVIKELESENAQEVWKEFEIRFQNVHSDFYKRLVNKFPDLSSNDLRLCAFLKLNLNTKEISSITNQSVNSIDVARSRLRQKLCLSKEDNLTAFLAGF